MNVLWIVIDCLREDALSNRGYHRPTSIPIDDWLEEDFIEFTDAVTQSAFTLNVFTSLVTGTYPSTHGVLRWHDQYNGQPTPYCQLVSESTLGEAEIVPAMNFVTDEWGLDKAFDTVHNLREKKEKRTCNQATANEVCSTAQEIIDKKDPFNLLLWFFDLHTPWLSEPEFNGKNKYRDNYDTEIRYVSEKIDDQFEYLKQTDQYEDTLIIFTGDHGEMFGEHQRLPWHPVTELVGQIPVIGRPISNDSHLGHLGRPLVEELVHVPLYVKLPKSDYGGEQVEGQVELIDILPTILDLNDIDSPLEIEGESLLPQIRGCTAGKEFTKAEMGPNYSDGLYRMIRSEEKKYLHHERPKFKQIESLHDIVRYVARRHFTPQEVLLSRKDESRNIIDEWPDEVKQFRKILKDWNSPTHSEERLTKTKKEELQNLGYL